MQDTIGTAKADFLQAKERLANALKTTPDDRLNWSPSPSARTPLQIAAHAAMSIYGIKETLDGRTFEAGSVADADHSFREAERKLETREQVLGLLEKNAGEYLAWLDTLTPERLASTVKAPFGHGTFPMTVALTFAPGHTHGHAAQVDYLQTIYGDHDWHM